MKVEWSGVVRVIVWMCIYTLLARLCTIPHIKRVKRETGRRRSYFLIRVYTVCPVQLRCPFVLLYHRLRVPTYAYCERFINLIMHRCVMPDADQCDKTLTLPCVYLFLVIPGIVDAITFVIST